jgi:hypothetical protein
MEDYAEHVWFWVFGILWTTILVVTIPIWGIPFAIYKIKKGDWTPRWRN